MTEFVTIRHPDIEATAVVPDTSLENHEARGWRRVEADLSSMSKADLLALASQKGVTVNQNARKDELVQALADADSTPPPAQ